MRALVTGGVGFIGSHLVESLLADGHAVTVLDNFDPFYPPALKRRTLAHLHSLAPAGALTLVEGDLRSPADLQRALAGEPPAIIAHLAALAGVRPSCQRPADYMDVNVTGTARLLEAARQAGVRRLLFASSSSVYGQGSPVPFRESEACGAPLSPYAASKRAGELLCHSYVHLYGFTILAARFFTVYGPRQRPDLAIHKFCRAIVAGEAIPLYGDGSSRRDYTYASDIIAGVRAGLEWTGEQAGAYEVVNLGGGQTTSLLELVRALERLLRRKAQIEWQGEQPGDVPLTYASTERAAALLGYAPQVSIEEGLARFVNWFLCEPEAGERGSEP